jgi:hypothetical protein
MFFSDSLIRHYTPPTCTLEIWAKCSPLSRWAERPLLKDLRFELRFDDPRVAEEEQVTLRGERQQLEMLCDIVITYVQNFLQESFNILPAMLDKAAPPPLVIAGATENSPLQSVSLLETSPADADNPRDSDRELETNIPSHPIPPSLRGKGLLAHELSFGSLAPQASTAKIILSSSQLFDLANTLEEYSAEAAMLPTLYAFKPRKATLVWASSAAVALLAVGLTVVGVRLFNLSNQPSESMASLKKSDSQPNSSNLIPVIPPVPPPPTGTPLPSPTLPPTLSARQPLLPPVSPKNSQAPIPAPSRVRPPTSSRATLDIVPQTANLPPLAAPNSTTQIPSAGASRRITISPNLPKLPSLTSPTSPPAKTPVDSSLGNLSAARESSGSPAAPPVSPKTTSLLDTIPQVAEAREYFQQRWQVPEGLNQTLEYRLILNEDGSIGRIIPLGRAASVYLDRTNMPLLGEPFVSPLSQAKKPTIRVVLSPNGTVRTFLE